MNKELIETLERISNEIEKKRKDETDLGIKTGLIQAEWIIRTEIVEQFKNKIK